MSALHTYLRIPPIPAEATLVDHLLIDLPAPIQGYVNGHHQPGHSLVETYNLVEMAISTSVPCAPTHLPLPTAGDPMDLGTMGQAARGGRRLTPAERQRHIERGECIACGVKGHWKGDPKCAVSGKRSTSGSRFPRARGTQRFNALEEQLSKLTEKLEAMGVLDDSSGNGGATGK